MKTETTPEEQKQNKKIGMVVVGIIIVCAMIFGKSSPSSSSSSSSSSGSHTCTYCGKSYSGNGYHHIGTRCEEASNGWEKYDNKCSMKCCEEAWSNGKH